MKFYVVDAFTNELFGGNPAGIVILDEDFPSEEIMIKTAAELRYSETAFIKILGEKEFQTRYFTPADEVDLCGHATIAAFTVLQAEGLAAKNGVYINRTRAGALKIEIQDGFVMMEMGKPNILGEIAEGEKLAELYHIMGLSGHEPHTKCQDLEGQGTKILPRLVSTGLPDIMMPVADIEALTSIKPDFQALTELSRRYDVVGVHAFCLATEQEAAEGITCHCRNFAPLYEIDEEAATGTSNGALTYYLRDSEIIADHADCVFVQGEAMGRPSIIRSRIDGERIMVGGSACILVKGDIRI